MVTHRLLGQVQHLADGAVGVALGNKREHAAFTIGEPRQFGLGLLGRELTELREERPGGAGVERGRT